jgi:AraC-like DNA-binding protein
MSVSRDIRLFANAIAALHRGDRLRIADVVRALSQSCHAGPAQNEIEREGSPWLRETRSLLHSRFHTAIRMRDIASHVGRHHVHVSRAFSHEFGMTMSEYLRNLRLSRACDLLLTSSQQLSRIAHGIGFSDHAHFTRVFTTVLGITPSSYRAANSVLLGARPPLYLYRSESELPGDSCADRGGRSGAAFAASRNTVGHAAG